SRPSDCTGTLPIRRTSGLACFSLVTHIFYCIHFHIVHGDAPIVTLLAGLPGAGARLFPRPWVRGYNGAYACGDGEQGAGGRRVSTESGRDCAAGRAADGVGPAKLARPPRAANRD